MHRYPAVRQDNDRFEHAAEKFALNSIKIGRWRLDAVRLNGDHITDPADPIKDQIGQGITDGFNEGFVQLDLTSVNDQVDPFAFWLRAKSRTIRGNMLKTLAMGCMRVFMMPSWSSDVTRSIR
jgi:hypothetical protein